MVTPRPGDTIHIGPQASVQFDDGRDLNLRVTAVDTALWQGWTFVHGYVVDQRGRAGAHRRLYVRIDGLIPVDLPTPALPTCHPGRPHAGRGLCRSCARRASRDGTLDNHPRLTWRRDHLLHRHRQLTALGLTRREVADRLGVTPQDIGNALRREREATP